ncbi:unnamed protein product, partial [Iphiclides podalirius]
MPLRGGVGRGGGLCMRAMDAAVSGGGGGERPVEKKKIVKKAWPPPRRVCVRVKKRSLIDTIDSGKYCAGTTIGRPFRQQRCFLFPLPPLWFGAGFSGLRAWHLCLGHSRIKHARSHSTLSGHGAPGTVQRRRVRARYGQPRNELSGAARAKIEGETVHMPY